MRLNKDNYISFSQYLNMIDKDTVSFDTAFIDKLDGKHLMDICNDILEEDKVELTFNHEESLFYNGKPHVLSNDIYGTPDLYFIIMRLNGLSHPIDLDTSKNVFVMNTNNIPELVSALDYYKYDL